MKKFNFIKPLINTGIDQSFSYELQRRIKLLNMMSLIISFVGFQFIYIFPYFIGVDSLSLITPFVGISLLSGIVLNFFKLHKYGSLFFLFFMNLWILVYAVVFPDEALINTTIIPTTLYPLLLFDRKKDKFLISLIICFSISIFILTEYFSLTTINQIYLSDEAIKTLSNLMILVVYVFTIVAFFHFIIVHKESEKRILNALSRAETAYVRAYDDLLESKGIQERVASDAAFGKLVRDIGNELTNLISIVMLLNEMVIQSLKTTLKEFSAFHENERESLSESLQSSNKINNFVDRIAELVKKIHSYGNESDEDIQYFPLHKLVNSVIELSKSNMKLRQITCSIDFSESNPKISGNRILLEQALMNILLNAIESIKRKGSIDIYTRVTDDNKVKISFVDDGEGMTPQMIEKAKKPFFSTKKGHAGLGISSVLKIVDQHNGQLSIESIPNEATVVTIEIPMFIDGLDKI